MYFTVNHAATYCYTGGKAFDAAKPAIIFIHGVLNDHSVWILQTRYLAHHGWNVLAVDLPGHCRSVGQPPASVEQAADFVIALMDAAGLAKAVLVGHSLGSLIALEAAARAPKRVSQLVLVGAAFPMKVSPALLAASQSEPMKALEMVNIFFSLNPGAAVLVTGARHLGLWRVAGTGAPGAGQQPAGQRLLHRLCGLRPLRQWRGGNGASDLPGAVCAGPRGPDDAAQGRPGPDQESAGCAGCDATRWPPADERDAGADAGSTARVFKT